VEMDKTALSRRWASLQLALGIGRHRVAAVEQIAADLQSAALGGLRPVANSESALPSESSGHRTEQPPFESDTVA
jgi:hypothetical protein